MPVPIPEPAPDVRAILLAARRELQAHGCDSPEMEADLLLAFAMGTNRAGLLARRRELPGAEALAQFRELLQRRCAREPLAYIIGGTDFYGRWIGVEPGVLVPRVDTEVIVDVALELLRRNDKRSDGLPDLVELGVGSGCIICTLLAELPDRVGVGLDISEVALRVTASNAERYGVGERLSLLKSDWYSALEPAWRGKLSLIVSNPPYIDQSEAAELQPEVRDYEPPQALFVGDQGFAALKSILSGAIDWLAPGGWVAVELGFGQAVPVKQMARDFGFSQVASRVDTGGVERVVYAQRPD